MWSFILVGRPKVLDPRPWFQVVDPRYGPTFAYHWDHVTVTFARASRAYVEYGNELDTLTSSMVSYLLLLASFHTWYNRI